MRLAGTTSDKPSEQSRYRSPATAAYVENVGETDMPLSALRMTCRFGCRQACSGVMVPASIRNWTNESSLVT